MDDAILRNQRRFNSDTADSWELYAPHRERLTALVLDTVAAGAGPQRLCVLGAGNCNDLDLARLCAAFDAVHLVDLDDLALAAGVARQGVVGTILHGGVDVTGVAALLAAYRRTPERGDDEGAALVRAASEAAAPDLGGAFDVVVSACMLSQLIDAVAQLLGTASPWSRDVALAVRDRHLRLLHELARPGGRALLVTDTLSTLAAPELADVQDDGLHAFLAERARAGRCFLGTNPAELLALVRAHPERAGAWARADVTPPWRWTLRSVEFLAYALRLSR